MCSFFCGKVKVFLALIICCLAAITVFFYSRMQTVMSIARITDFPDKYNLYRMDIRYDYDVDRIVGRGISDTETFVSAVVRECLPFLPVKIDVPKFGCSAFHMRADKHHLTGRNYDFKRDTSAMLVYCHPDNGYKSVSFAALDNVRANNPESSWVQKLVCLTSPFLPLDGINEKGVAVAILALDSEPVRQRSGKPVITTCLAVRQILDHCASAAEAVEMLKRYDMLAINAIDCHIYVTDSGGDARIIEYDPSTKEMLVLPTDAITNFYYAFKDKVVSNGKNGIYGHGKDRYDKIVAVQKSAGIVTKDTAIKALQVAQQNPNPNDITSNTQWSVVYDNTDLTADIVIRRRWGDNVTYSLKQNSFLKM